jgi:hypothetical protein
LAKDLGLHLKLLGELAADLAGEGAGNASGFEIDVLEMLAHVLSSIGVAPV